MGQSQPLRVEYPDFPSLITSKTIKGRLYFANNRAFEERTLGYYAKYLGKYRAKTYAIAFQGNHIHNEPQFPHCNRAHFCRGFNARTAEAARALIPEYEGGPIYARRYAEQALPLPEDIEDRFFYCALQAVNAGLCERISDYPGYNSFWDAINGVSRTYKVVDSALALRAFPTQLFRRAVELGLVMGQSQPLRIEYPDFPSFITSKTIKGRLYFVNNSDFEQRTLGYYAKYLEKHQAKTYAIVLQGSHIHHEPQFPHCNRAHFCRDFNARTAEAARALIPQYEGGPIYARRYAEQALPLPADIKDRFFYSALQAVIAGLCERIGDYPGYNSFWDAINGVSRTYKVVDYTGYRRAKRAAGKFGKKPNIKDFTTRHILKFERLPGYEHLSQKEYRRLMLQKLEERRLKIVKEWKEKGHRFLTKDELRRVVPGSLPYHTKTSKRDDHRPLVLTRCRETRRAFLRWYFLIYAAYKAAVKRYFAGELDVEFPPNTYRPPGLNIRRAQLAVLAA